MMARRKLKAASSSSLPAKQENLDALLSPTGKEKPPIPSIFIPPTPPASNGPTSQDLDELWALPPSPPPSLAMLPSATGSQSHASKGGEPPLSAAVIASPELLELASFQASIKQALASLSSTMETLEVQSERMQQMGADIKIHGQIELLRTEVEEQVNRQKSELANIEQMLREKVKEALAEHIKASMRATVRETIRRMVEGRVHDELITQVPEKLREGLLTQQRQIEEVKATIHNSEARRYNSSLNSASGNVPLRPLLRPLPTPEQSPVPNLSTSAPNSRLPSARPLSAYPHATAANTPFAMRRSVSGFSALPSAISRSQSLGLQPISAATPSALFPRDLNSLFALKHGDAKALLKEYGLKSAASSPISEEEKMMLKAPKMQKRSSSSKAVPKVHQPSIPEESENSEDEEEFEEHVQDMNTFMAHIGVPFLMVPPPKSKESNTERRKKLAPLIIGTTWRPIR
ncbi:hypothetical protein BKA70DRAFT_1261076 [Coprinopsis sp. MPI-PUGE-AT-0042]|nr:hypothetical protein BKA70DRAFT_1261076 [Coprinopsis sp. MPI-PUGE-AT-0042]